MAFLPTKAPLARALAERNYNEPTPVQEAVLAPEAEHRDLLVSAQTGSGKTVAYGLAIASTLLEGDAETLGQAGDPLALIVAPTRELALQVHRELTWLYEHAGARVVSCVGGMDPRHERRQLADGCHIVVGTPGRLRDHLERRGLKISALKAVVLDEADEMLDLGFREDLEFILETTPEERRTLLFSATLPRGIVALAKRYQRTALRIEVTGGDRGHADIEYRAMRIAAHDMEHAVVNALRYFDAPSTLVFCNTREAVRHLQAILLERGFSVVALSGELDQNRRNQALQALRDGRARVCVATDVAARGIDLPGLGLVIHADLPHDAEVLQHRSGRTGRAGRKGVSVLLVPLSRRRRAEQLLGSARIRAVWGTPPTAEDIRKLDQERLLESLRATEGADEGELAMARDLLAQHPAEQIAAALVRLYRAQLPAAEDLSDPGDAPQRGAGAAHERERARGPQRGGAAHAESQGDKVWFRLNVGRQKKADPKWLIPLICRQGGITKGDIGSIRIFHAETKFEIDAAIATEFAQRVSEITTGPQRIEPTEPPSSEGGSRRP
ncbi:MAG TPA: DEAD/DEAH box helicase, partial [Alphaproteobacteria bacterium]|nr:DEAD/DEAH box helicase [Alphaproteobacteria bacterium]